MSDPCRKEGDIARHDERIKIQDEILSSLSKAVEKLNITLSSISTVMTDNKHLHEDQKRNEQSINELFRRVRCLELAPGKAAGKAWWLFFGSATGCVGGVISGVIVWFVTRS